MSLETGKYSLEELKSESEAFRRFAHTQFRENFYLFRDGKVDRIDLFSADFAPFNLENDTSRLISSSDIPGNISERELAAGFLNVLYPYLDHDVPEIKSLLLNSEGQTRGLREYEYNNPNTKLEVIQYVWNLEKTGPFEQEAIFRKRFVNPVKKLVIADVWTAEKLNLYEYVQFRARSQQRTSVLKPVITISISSR